jgi:N utilization substance protein B
MKEFCVPRKAVRELLGQRAQISLHLTEIDEKIRSHSLSYDFHRIPKVELNVLRLAIFEMMYLPTVPPKVSIAEAIRLTRKYSTSESSSFVNAILDKFYKTEVKETPTERQEDEQQTTVSIGEIS